MRSALRIWGCLLLWACSLQPARAGCDWPEWEQFKDHYISEEGRVIDPADGRRITTSEGQSYGLFFALVNDDRETFERLLQWTEVQLARGDLTGFLPAWQWGTRNDGSLGVLDDNSAADSDLWIAYSLLEAGRLWQNHSYQSIGTMLLRRIAREEVARLPGLGPVLLPAPRGFSGEGRWTLNPSYLPPQLLARFASMQGPWQEMRTLLPALLTATAPRGFAPDWIDWRQASGWQVTEGKGSVGSYDGIRVYLWLGMLSEDDPAREALVRHFHPMLAALTEPGVAESVDTPTGEALTGQGVPERVDTLTGEVLSRGDHGFAAALLPLASGLPLAAQLPQQPLIQGDGYYASVLTLFGHGWAQGRFRFAADGTLLPRWSDQCQPVR
ncbi:cellulose synthase complex periplasmic endoglucanase BcsZ [Aeromonas veronii]|uniref:cellulose synthase complex periplasmic endoglucanase BcsZ n=1 Tax=Aeromonas veronii TaxID=654 RepID=UPI002248724B|nr:cellulose synthase complex periplasmic endoglucanase BcsZ [Aeromonas veronii]MCX0427089.1 cellulose synthase complex periplasmic endoglucanase BcsZ [Aeromonas veronii]MCX0448195.1 cellulose synthase complex periplasmic endoglucanase BcsZ [Aeromonas veronii]